MLFGTEGETLLSAIERCTAPFSQIFAHILCLKFGVRFSSLYIKKQKSDKITLLFLAQVHRLLAYYMGKMVYMIPTRYLPIKFL